MMRMSAIRRSLILAGALALTAPGAALAVEEAPPVPVTLDAPARFSADYLVGGTLVVGVTPADYTGRIVARTSDGTVLATADASRGRARLRLPADELGTVRLRLEAAATPGFAAAAARTAMKSQGVVLKRWQRHPVVKPLLRRLREMNYLTPKPTNQFSKPVRDVVLAFQKVHGLQRTAMLDRPTWRTFASADPVTARHRGSGTHIEVDKTRQIMMLVTNGKVRGTLHVSTGKTGNTPEGRFRIYAKGVGSLYRFMPFKGNFGIHGYIPVPAWPASHGCVREPMWAADWTYERTRVGTPVIIYR